MGVGEVVDAADQIGHAGERAAPDGLLADQPEPALDLVQPGRVGGREVQVVARAGGQPGLDLGMLVRRVASARDKMRIRLDIKRL